MRLKDILFQIKKMQQIGARRFYRYNAQTEQTIQLSEIYQQISNGVVRWRPRVLVKQWVADHLEEFPTLFHPELWDNTVPIGNRPKFITPYRSQHFYITHGAIQAAGPIYDISHYLVHWQSPQDFCNILLTCVQEFASVAEAIIHRPQYRQYPVQSIQWQLQIGRDRDRPLYFHNFDTVEEMLRNYFRIRENVRDAVITNNVQALHNIISPQHMNNEIDGQDTASDVTHYIIGQNINANRRRALPDLQNDEGIQKRTNTVFALNNYTGTNEIDRSTIRVRATIRYEAGVNFNPPVEQLLERGEVYDTDNDEFKNYMFHQINMYLAIYQTVVENIQREFNL